MFIKRLLIILFLLLLPNSAFAADSTVTALTAASALSGTELFYCVQSSADRKCTAAQAGTYILTSPVLTGTPTIPTPFTLGATSVTSTGTQLNYLNAATGTTGTASTNIVFSTSPVLVTPNLGTPSTLVLTNATGIPSAITLTNGTGLPIAGITGLGTNQATFLGQNLTVNGALRLNGSGVPSQAACTNLSDATGLCSATYVASSSWTPSDNSGAGLTFTSVSATYQRTGNWVTASFSLTYPVTASGANAVIAGLAIPTSASGYGVAPGICYSTVGIAIGISATAGTANFVVANLVTGAAITNVTLSTKALQCTVVYSGI